MIKIEFVSIFTGISEKKLKHFNEYPESELRYRNVDIIEYVDTVTSIYLDLIYNRYVIPYNIWWDDNLVWNDSIGFTDFWKKYRLITELKS